ncbi:hypothetical protein EDB81DRAFT_752457 [Dactylonectria macrodidyma]|uniref:Uncharacterized protein n=1 Tax=Dactylonectria macrodidyma TaxID=307937 RepID=A0A9P9JG43_9HYPO|nr:hypothetical protein EDB81DRAFT_752457 [Dactylonectria macrodidyma]
MISENDSSTAYGTVKTENSGYPWQKADTTLFAICAFAAIHLGYESFLCEVKCRLVLVHRNVDYFLVLLFKASTTSALATVSVGLRAERPGQSNAVNHIQRLYHGADGPEPALNKDLAKHQAPVVIASLGEALVDLKARPLKGRVERYDEVAGDLDVDGIDHEIARQYGAGAAFALPQADGVRVAIYKTLNECSACRAVKWACMRMRNWPSGMLLRYRDTYPKQTPCEVAGLHVSCLLPVATLAIAAVSITI